jgi:hypothetical protein
LILSPLIILTASPPVRPQLVEGERAQDRPLEGGTMAE